MGPEDLAAEIRADIRALPRRYTPEIREVRKAWSARLKPASAAEVVALARALALRLPQEIKWVAYELIRHHRTAYESVSQAELEGFAADIASWYATDALGTVLIGPLWAKGRVSDGLIMSWTASPNRWLRRSALVATVGLNARTGDPARTFAVCRALAADRDDMVQKALSWALRFLSQRDKPAVEAFMTEMGETLPARVRREVAVKLRTGRKAARKAGAAL
jgi:3-methyladenine DNA glycosylase AlkD